MLNRSRLRHWRVARGYSLEELASEMGGIVTKQALSKYESGKAQPSQAVLNKLAVALKIKAAGLCSEPDVSVEFHGFRKTSRLGKREQEAIQSWVTSLLEDRARLQDVFALKPAQRLPVNDYAVSCLPDVETAAMKLRERWSLGEAPIADVTNTLEDWLVHVIEISDHEKFDGLSASVKDASNQVKAWAVIVSSEATGERQRFSLAHELGHLVMDMGKKVDSEDAANRFAGAFLAPRNFFFSVVGKKRHHIAQEELFLLKQKFGMSVQALLYRMKDLEIIAETYYRQWCIQINKFGWRRSEPAPVLREQPKWFRRSILRAVTEDLITKEEAEQMLGEALDSAEPLTLVQRKAFMKLPLEERRKIMAKQAKELADYYESDREWREGEGDDFIEY